jgi:ABC-type multidrug transport system ATPase subunit
MKNNGICIRTEKLNKTFGTVQAVRNLDLEVSSGSRFGFLGPNGAGKTTTMRLLTAIMEPTSGEAWVAGHSIIKEGERIVEDKTFYENFFVEIGKEIKKLMPAERLGESERGE